MKSDPRLVIEFGDGASADEYRIHNREVQFRARRRERSSIEERNMQWRQLTADDISTHLALHTVVGEWLTLRLFETATGQVNPLWKSRQRDWHHTYLERSMPSRSFSSGEEIPSSGVYRVAHAAHKLPQQVTLVKGQKFPPCSECESPVHFTQVRRMNQLDNRRGIVILHVIPVLKDRAA